MYPLFLDSENVDKIFGSIKVLKNFRQKNTDTKIVVIYFVVIGLDSESFFGNNNISLSTDEN